MDICNVCGEEVRLGERDGKRGFWHRTDVDHHVRFGDPAPTRAESLAARERWLAANADAELEEEIPDPRPDPEVRSTPLPITGSPVGVPLPDGTERVVKLPGGAKTVVNKARPFGWDISATYSRGPWMHSTRDANTGIFDAVLVRFTRGAERVVAFWRNGKFEFAYIWTDGKVGRERVNSKTLKEHLTADSNALEA